MTDVQAANALLLRYMALSKAYNDARLDPLRKAEAGLTWSEAQKAFGEFKAVQAGLLQKMSQAEARDTLIEQFADIVEKELERLPKKRKATQKEIDTAVDKAAGRIAALMGKEMFNIGAAEYKSAVQSVARELKTGPIALGGRHKRAIRLALEGRGMAETFAGFSLGAAKTFRGIITEAYESGKVEPGRIVSQMIDEVGWEVRPRLEAIAKTETHKIWELARYEAYKEVEEERGEQLKYRFGTKDDERTCVVCTEVMEASKNGLPLEELRELMIQTSMVHNPKWNPTRDSEWPLMHIGCRHRFFRTGVLKKPVSKALTQPSVSGALTKSWEPAGTSKKGTPKWRNTQTGEVRYQSDKPGDRQHNAQRKTPGWQEGPKISLGYRSEVESRRDPPPDWNPDAVAAWLRIAKLGIQVTSSTLRKIVEDGAFKTQHSTGTTGGQLDPETRAKVEDAMFGRGVRPTYGFLTHRTSRSSTDDILYFGRVSVILKDEVKNHSTFVTDDSLLDALEEEVLAPSPINNPHWTSLSPGVTSDGDLEAQSLYVEAQIQKRVTLADIEKVIIYDDSYVANDDVAPELLAALDSAGIPYEMQSTYVRKAPTSYTTDLYGLKVVIEYPQGSIRTGKGPDGDWVRRMVHDYGRIKRTEGADGEAVDVFVGPRLDSGKVFVVNQLDTEGSFDEHKCMLGFRTEEEARKGYLAHYPPDWKCGPIKEMGVEEFKEWVRSDATTRIAKTLTGMGVSETLTGMGLSERLRMGLSERLSFLEKEWQPFRGARGGQGWKNSATGEVRYQTEKPGEREPGTRVEGRFQSWVEESGAEVVQPGHVWDRAEFADPHLLTTQGMKLHPLDTLTGDPNDKGLYGVHVGNAEDWVPILAEDYGRDPARAVIVDIVAPEGLNLAVIEDPNPIDRTEVPSSWILVSDQPRIGPEHLRIEGQPSPPVAVQPDGSLQSEPGFLYHATNEERAREIALEALNPHTPDWGTEQEAWPDGALEPRSYFSPKANVVWQFAPEEGKPVVLRVRQDQRFRRESTGDVYATTPVQAEELEILTAAGWIPLTNWAGRGQQVLKASGAYCDVNGHCFPSKNALGGHVARTGHSTWQQAKRQRTGGAGRQEAHAARAKKVLAKLGPQSQGLLQQILGDPNRKTAGVRSTFKLAAVGEEVAARVWRERGFGQLERLNEKYQNPPVDMVDERNKVFIEVKTFSVPNEAARRNAKVKSEFYHSGSYRGLTSAQVKESFAKQHGYKLKTMVVLVTPKGTETYIMDGYRGVRPHAMQRLE